MSPKLENIMRLAEEAGFAPMSSDLLACCERFAILVAAAEREECAKVAEGFPANRDWVPGSLWGNIRAEVAKAIRARGTP